MTVHWLTTAPNPRSKATGFDAGQRGWRLHAVITDKKHFSEIGNMKAVCGCIPAHGWSLDLFIEDKCVRCERMLKTWEAKNGQGSETDRDHR